MAVGLIGGLAQIFITQAYRLAPVAVISPFQYSQLLWGLAFGYLVFGDRPDPVMLLGAAIIVACGLYILRRETRPPPVRADAAPPAAGDMR